MEWNGGMENSNGTVNITNSCNWCCSSKLSYQLYLGLLSHCRGCRRKSCLISLYHSQKMGLPYSGSQRLATIPCMGDMLTTVKEGCTHICV